MDSPIVSISCITYNHVSFIRECLDGFVMQKTNFPFEVIIHDDASTDGTANVIREYEREFPNIIFPIYQTENQWSKGRKPTWEFNLPRWRGKYIAFCEGDDYWADPLKLQKQVDFLEENDDYGLIHGNCDFYHEDKNTWTRNSNKNLKNDNHVKNYKEQFELLVDGSYKIRTASVLFQRSLLKYYEYMNNKFLMGDTPMWLEFSQLTKFKYVDETWSVYRMHGSSLTNSNNLTKTLRFRLSSAEMRVYYSKKFNIEIKESLRKKYNKILLYYRLYDCYYVPIYPLLQPTVYQKFKFNYNCNILLNYIFRAKVRFGRYLRTLIKS